MKNISVLVKSLFINSFRGEGKGKKGQANNIIGMLISGIVFTVMFAAVAVFMGPLFYAQGLTAEFITLIFLSSQLIVLIFGTVIMVNIMFFSKDAEMMLYLPIKPVTVFAAKMIYVYLTELVLSAFMVIVIGVVFGAVCGLPVTFFILLIPALFIVPMLPLILSSLFTVPIMYVVSFLKNKSVLASVFFVALFAVFMYFYMNFIGNMAAMEDGETIVLPVDIIRRTMGYIIPNIALARIVTLTSANYLIDILLIIAFTVGLFGLSLLISSFTYRKGMASQLEETRSKSSGKIKYEQNSALKSFLLKEIREIIRTPSLAFYCMFQVVIAPLMIFFYGSLMTSSMDGTGDVLSQTMSLGIGFLFAIMMVAGINYTAISSISREGVNFNMSKALPAPYIFQIRAKLILADIVMALGMVTSFLVMVIFVGGGILECLLFLGFGLILGDAFTNLLTYLDAKNPKLDWESISVALKNSKASLVSTLVSFPIGIIFFAGYMVLDQLPTHLTIPITVVFWVFFYILAIVLNVLFRRLLNNNIERIIANLEN